MRILNLFAGIGGNRTLWGNKHEITAVEMDQKIAMIYHKRFPNDKVIVGDAYQYNLDHHHEYGLVWASPKCQSHSRVNHFLNAQGIKRYPDMGLWKLIIYLRQFHDGFWIVENVQPYYHFIKESFVIDRHYFWSNIPMLSTGNRYNGVSICNAKLKNRRTTSEHVKEMQDYHGIHDVSDRYMLSSCVKPEIAKIILDQVIWQQQKSLKDFI